MPVGQVAAMRQVEPQDGVARLQHRAVSGLIGLRTRVRLNVRVFSAKELFGPVACQILDNVGELATAIVTASGVTLGIFVGENTARRLQHSFGGEVLTGYHLQVTLLAFELVGNGGEDFRVSLGERAGERVHARFLLRVNRPIDGNFVAHAAGTSIITTANPENLDLDPEHLTLRQIARLCVSSRTLAPQDGVPDRLAR